MQTVDPVILACDVIDLCDCCIPLCTSFPQCILKNSQDTVPSAGASKAVLVTLGLFSIVQMERDVQILIPAYDYCIPKRECECNTQNPCDTFQNIDFPVDEFFPPEKSDGGGCCCDKDDKDSDDRK